MAATHNTNVVFIDTNLDTHFALLVSDLDTVSDFKKSILSEHLSCFPKIGQIQIHGVKVKRKGYFYHLSDSMLVRSAFSGCNKGWFLSVEASVLRECAQNEQLLALASPNQAASVGIANNGLIGHGDDAVGFDNFKLPQLENELVGNEEIAVASRGSECTAKGAGEKLDAGVKLSGDNDTGIPLTGAVECRVDGSGAGLGGDLNVCEDNSLISAPSGKRKRKSKKREGDTVRGENSKDVTASVDNTLSFQSKGTSHVTNELPDVRIECKVDEINKGIKDACIVLEEENSKSVSNVKKKEDTVQEDTSKVNDVSVVGSGIEAVAIPSENADKEVIGETDVLKEHQHTVCNNNKTKNDIDADVSMEDASEPRPAAKNKKKKNRKRKRSLPVDSEEMSNVEMASQKHKVQKSDEAPKERKESRDQFELENKKSADDKATEDILDTKPPAKKKKRGKEKDGEKSFAKASQKDEVQKDDEAPKERKESKDQFELEDKKYKEDKATEDIFDTRPPAKKKKRSKDKGGEKSLSNASQKDELQKDDEAPKEKKESKVQFELENKKSGDDKGTEDILDTRPPAKKKKRSKDKGGEKSLSNATLINDLNVDNASHDILEDQQVIKNTNADQSAEHFNDTDSLKSSVRGRRRKGKLNSSNPPETPVVTSLKKDEEADHSSIQRGAQEKISEDDLNVDNASHDNLEDQQVIKNTNADQSAEHFNDTDSLKSSVRGRRRKGKLNSSNPPETPVVTSLKKDEEADHSSIQRGAQEKISEDDLFSKDISMSNAAIDNMETGTDACKEGIQITEKITGNYSSHSDIEIQTCTSNVDEPMEPTEDDKNVVLGQCHENGTGQIEGIEQGREVSPQNDPKLMLLEKFTSSNQDNTNANIGELNVTSDKKPSLSSDSGMPAKPSVVVTRNRKSARKKSTKTISEPVKDSVRLEPSDSRFSSGGKNGARDSTPSPGEKDDDLEASSKTKMVNADQQLSSRKQQDEVDLADDMLVDNMNGTDRTGIVTMAGKNMQGLEATDQQTHAEDLSSSQQLSSKEQLDVRINPGMKVPNVHETRQASKLSGMSDSAMSLIENASEKNMGLEKRIEHFPVSNSKAGKASRNNVRRVVSKTQQKKSLLAGEIFQDDNSSGSEDEVDNSDASTRSPSDKPPFSDFSDGDSSSDSHGGKSPGNGGRSSLKASFSDSKGISIDRLLRSSTRFKKARTVASQLEESESQPEFVPDSLFD